MKRTLFDIGEELLRIHELVDDFEIDGPDTELNLWFETIAQEEELKLDAYCSLILQLTMEQHAAKVEANGWLQKAQRRERRVKWLKMRLMQHLLTTGRTKALTASGRKVTVQNDGGAQPLVIDEEVNPRDFPTLNRVTVEWDKEKVRKELEANGDVLHFAKLAPRGQHLRIRL